MSISTLLKNLESSDLSKISYEKLTGLFVNGKVKLPITTAIIKKGTEIERGRVNYEGETFSSENDISFRTDTKNITQYGRANQPGHTRFYGSFGTEKIPHARVGIFAELCPEYRYEPVSNIDRTITVGKWEVTEKFEVAQIVFSDAYLKNPEIIKALEHWTKEFSKPNSELNKDDYKQLLIFFSNQFAKSNITNHHDYKLSCLFSDFAIFGTGLPGVIYPSVRAEYLVNNIVLEPKAVEKYLKLKAVGEFRLHVKDGEGMLEPIRVTKKLGKFNTSFEW